MIRFDRRMLAHFDWWLLIMFLLICAMSLFNLYSASYPPKPWGTPPYLKQLYFYLIGFSAILVILAVDYQELHFWNYFFYIFVVGLLAAILIIGKTAGGAQRWIVLGPVTIQASEFAKFAAVAMLAMILVYGLGLSLASMWNALAGKPVKISYALIFGIIFLVSAVLLIRDRSAAAQE